ncbi:MAG: shikimate kinase AroL [Desulfotignum sp.]|nr:shikimate kinase AroL [Desulfotignum sp.]MCF8136837.1 shikimate kinase AroL [Desulfotignum sp.]
MPCNLILIGYRCCGKTCVGKLLADLLSYDFVDTDNCIESVCRSSIDILVADKGWPYFRQKETQTLAQVLRGNSQVIATGGGMVLAPENRALLKTHGFVIWLTADVTTIVQRLEADPRTRATRPRFTSRSLADETRDTLAQRIPFYEALADMTVDTTVHTPQHIAEIIKRRLDHVRI